MAEQALAQKKQAPLILQFLDKYKDQIALALPRHMTADRMARIVTTEVRKTPQLLNCNPKSLFGAVIQCSQLGLEPGNALGHAYLVPFSKEVTLIIGYRGMIDLARRSGQIVSLQAKAVFEGDEFDYAFGLEDRLHHKPVQDPKVDRGELTHAYAIAKLVGGGVQWEVMTRAEIESIRAQSKAGKNGPWVTHFEEMAKKTVLRRLFKYLPVSVEMNRAVGLDELGDVGRQDNDRIIDGEFSTFDDLSEGEDEPKSRTDSVKGKLASQSGKAKTKQADDAAPTYAEIAESINTADGEEAIDEALSLAGHLPEDQVDELATLAQTRRQELETA